LFNYIRYVVKLRELVSVVILEHTFGAYKLMAVSTKVLYLPLLVHVTVDPRIVRYFGVSGLSGHDDVLGSY
jgi:hypothetical protein